MAIILYSRPESEFHSFAIHLPGAGTNGHHSEDVEMAEEAVESQNGGFLKKTISKIWSGSSSSLSGGAASSATSQQPPQTSSSGGGCVIS